MKLFMVMGHGPNDMEIPLVPFIDKQEAEVFVEKFPKDPRGGLEGAFSEKEAPYVDDKYEHTLLGDSLYRKLFKDGNYYSGCGGCYALSIVECEIGQPMVGWDLD